MIVGYMEYEIAEMKVGNGIFQFLKFSLWVINETQKYKEVKLLLYGSFL